MRLHVLPLLVLAVTATATDAFAQRRRSPGLPGGWFVDYAAARTEAKKTGKPLLVMFH